MHRRGEVSSPDGLGQPTPTGSMVCDNTTIAPLEHMRGLEVSRCYRHIAPLERKAPTHQNSRVRDQYVGAGLPRPMGWGSQRLRVQGCATIPHCAPLECGLLDVSRCYRHIAPLERKAPMHQNSRCVMHRRGGVASLDGLGQPTPTGSMVCDNTTLRSSGARGLDVSRCYRHIAPLERKAKPNHPPSPNPY